VKPWTDKARQPRARLETADNDYADGTIDAKLLNKTKARIQAELTEIDKRLASRRGTAALGGIITATRPRAGVPRGIADESAGGDRRAVHRATAPGCQGPVEAGSHAARGHRPEHRRHRMAVTGSPIRLVRSQPGPQAKAQVKAVFTPHTALAGYPWASPVRLLCLLGDVNRRGFDPKHPRFRLAPWRAGVCPPVSRGVPIAALLR
jgi:hypothetical protein